MEFHQRVRLDRYAIKDSTRDLLPHDLVVVSIERTFDKEARPVESREIGNVLLCHLDGTHDIVLDNDKREVVEKVPRNKLEYVVEKTYPDICRRVAHAVAGGDDAFEETVYRLMVEEKFIAAGRILAGLGRPDFTLTLFNCYVYCIKGDSRSAIADHWGRLFETFARGGGVGTPLSILRPKGAVVKKVNGRSSGSVSWAEQFSQITGAVEQGGSRRGASKLDQWCWHPDVEETIQVKSERETFRTPSGEVVSRNKKLLENANVSIMLTNDFMKQVEQNGPWDLVFPDLDDPDYDSEWDGDLWRWRDELGKKVVVYKTMKARDLWNQIIQKAWESGEPGLVFMERCNDLSNSYYYCKLDGNNPCSEQVLPSSGVCNLGHINLSRFVLTDDQFPTDERTGTVAAKQVDWDGLAEAVQTGIRFLDQTSDLNQYHDAEVEKQQTSERRVGLGLLGYGEMLIRLGLRYGSEEAIKFTSRLMKHFSTQSYLASVELAKTKGTFPQFDEDKFLKSGFMRRHTKEVKEAVEQHGIRNVTCNTIAPTGSTASLLRTTGGCEPYFALQYTSTTRIGVVEERQPIADELASRFGPDEAKWPSYVVTAQKGITPEHHVLTQGAMQRWIDAAISKTINLPKSATVEDVAESYMMMWAEGCKGGTVYRDGALDEQVLYSEVEPEPEVVVVDETPDTAKLQPRPDAGLGVTFSEKSPLGTVHATIRHNPQTGAASDFFVLSSRGDVAADAEAIGRLISIILRWPNKTTITPQARLEIVRDQLMDILGRNQIGIGPSARKSLPDTIGKIIEKYLAADFPLAHLPFGAEAIQQLFNDIADLGGDKEAIAKLAALTLYGKDTEEVEDQTRDHQEEMEQAVLEAEQNGIELPCDLCPECGSGTLVTIPGKCPYCRTCGHTRC